MVVNHSSYSSRTRVGSFVVFAEGSTSDVMKITDLEKTNFSGSSYTLENESVGAASLAFDGNDETRFATAVNDGAGAYLMAEFPTEVSIHSVKINECTIWGNITEYEIQYWSNSEWKVAYDGDTTTQDVIDINPVVNTNKIRLYCKAIDTARYNGITIWEFEVMGTYDTSKYERPISIGHLEDSTYLASTEDSAPYIPEMAFDSDRGSRWASKAEDGAGAFLEVNFKKEYYIDSFLIDECVVWGNITSYEAQIFVDNEWKTVHSGDTTTPTFINISSEKATSKFRILVNSINGERYNGVTIYEVQVFGYESNVNPQTYDSFDILSYAIILVLALFSLKKRFLVVR